MRQLDPLLTDEFLESKIKEIEEKGVSMFEVSHSRKDDSTLVWEVHSRIIESGSKKFILNVERDITERKRM